MTWHLRESDFFSGLSEEKDAFMSLARRRELNKNEIVFFEDDPGNSCFYLEKGIIKIFKIGFDGKEPIFFLRRPGEFFGLAEVVGGQPRKANAQAITPVVLHEITKRDFESLLANHYLLARKIIGVLGRRLRYLGELIESLMVCDVSTRLAKLLVYLSYEKLTDEASWLKPVDIPVNLTQEQIAAMTGSCQQTVSELLKKFQEERLIEVSRRKITVLNPLKLLSKAEN
ncbi:MAG: Crp/Fnr family transcriptional regulator [Deltaproteobacteria bacterium]|nr:Crp/Fnr family transcriptional regulator [Deltaproteobacteria bacterium]